MKFAVVSVVCDPIGESCSKHTWPALKAYADSHGFDHAFVGLPEGEYWKLKYDFIQSALTEYDRILYVSAHVLIRHDCPNVFELVPGDSIGMFEQGDIDPDAKAALSLASYYNSDVIVASREHSSFFGNRGDTHDVTGFKFFNLPYRYNRLVKTLQFTGEIMEDSYLANMSGLTRPDADFLIDNFKRFRVNGVPAMYKHLLIDTPGALGDCVANEPVVRYITQVLEPQAKVLIRTNFPEVFFHLSESRKNIFCIPKDAEQPAGYLRSSLQGEGLKASFNLMHCLDFGSISALGGTLPKEHRSIFLSSVYDFPELKDHILIHPGSTWPSRTFPSWYWQEIIDLLTESGYPVAIIGKTYPDGKRGTVDVDVSQCLDLRNKLSIAELIGAIRDSRMLISNDSSPIHIAGAFLNPTILLNSAKHHDFIWPHRSPELNITLGKPIEAASHKVGIVNNTRIDLCDEKEMLSRLPSAEEVLRSVNAFFSRS